LLFVLLFFFASLRLCVRFFSTLGEHRRDRVSHRCCSPQAAADRALSPGERGGPTPEVLSLGLVVGTTICLLSSSATIHLAERALRQGGEAGFRLWWTVTILLGLIFLAGTAYEWRDLIAQGLTIRRNLFGTTYYTLVGFHGVHVSVGVIIMLIVLGLALRRQVTASNPHGVELVSWYWHFVDGVWVVVFTVVYLVGR